MSKPIAHLGDLTPDPQNARAHNAYNVGMIERALNDVGAARSIVIDEDGVVLAGNATIEAAAQAGIERVRVVEADGNELIAVQRRGLTPEQKARLAVYDNRTAEIATWDAGILAQLAATDPVISELWPADDWAALLAQTAPLDIGGAGDDFDPTPADGPTRTQPGDLWLIDGGRHRLLVGDCTDPANVARLMGGERAALCATDPPYNVGIDYGDATDDTKIAAVYEAFCRLWFANAQGASARQIVTPGYNNLASWCRFFDKPHHVAPWTKTNSMTRGHVSRFACWEPMLFYGVPWARTRANDVFAFPVSAQMLADGTSLTPLHPCPKPLGMWVDLLENYTDRGDLVYDPFGGSGTTLIAAHQTGRRCYGMEISEKYCDVILRRAEAAGLPCARAEP